MAQKKLDGAHGIISILSDAPNLIKYGETLRKFRELAVDALGYKNVNRILHTKKRPMGYFKFWIGGAAGNEPSYITQYPSFVTFSDKDGFISHTTLEEFKTFMQGYKDLN